MIAAALNLAKTWSVFPCRPGEKLPATAHGCKDATRDFRQVEAWWTAMPDANIGVATGHVSDIWVLDVDGDEGEETLVELGGFPKTLTQRTPSGGLHFVFRDPLGLGNSVRKLGPGLDTRGNGGYIVAAPSRTQAGSYQWVERSEPLPPPGWLLRLARPPEPEPVQLPALEQVAPAKSIERYVEAALDSECRELAGMTKGSGRNHALNRAAFKLGGFVASGLLDSETLFARLLQACSANGLLGEDGERQCRKSIQSGFSAGLAKPRSVA